VRNLYYNRRLVVVDVETTGTQPKTARVVQLAYRVYAPGQLSETFKTYVNPGMAIPPASTLIHGITDDMVKDAPTFQQLFDEGKLTPLTGIVDYSGFNVRFDLAVLASEFGRLGLGFSLEGASIVDGFRLWQILEPRSLGDAVRHFLGREPRDSHDAMADVDDTIDVIEEQLERHRQKAALNNVTETTPPVLSVSEVHDVCFPKDPSWVDGTGKFVWSERGDVLWNFGKYAGRPLAGTDPGMLRWVLNQDFASDVKQIVGTYLLNGTLPTRGA
jgi:DNA polymerase-3 subunit epsilon